MADRYIPQAAEPCPTLLVRTPYGRGFPYDFMYGSSRTAGQDGWTEVEIPMSSTAHRFAAGHRLRVQVSGGAHPRWARNTGTTEQIATATRLVPVEIGISHEGAVLLLPAVFS